MNDARGFSLIEMLITLGIFGIISGLVLVNFHVGQQGDELRLSARLVESKIRRAQTAAISGQTIPVCKGGVDDLKTCPSGESIECGGGGVCERDIPRGYGIHFASSSDPRTIIYFADTDGDKIYDEGESITEQSVSSGAFVFVASSSPSLVGVLDIVFVPPKPTIFFNGSAADAVASITLRHETTGDERVVSLNRISGQVTSN